MVVQVVLKNGCVEGVFAVDAASTWGSGFPWISMTSTCVASACGFVCCLRCVQARWIGKKRFPWKGKWKIM